MKRKTIIKFTFRRKTALKFNLHAWITLFGVTGTTLFSPKIQSYIRKLLCYDSKPFPHILCVLVILNMLWFGISNILAEKAFVPMTGLSKHIILLSFFRPSCCKYKLTHKSEREMFTWRCKIFVWQLLISCRLGK